MINDTPSRLDTHLPSSLPLSSRNEATPPPSPPRRLSVDSIFGSDDDETYANPQHPSRQPIAHSNLPLLKRTHGTAGYRDGVAVSKEKFLQEGFDEGWALGAEVGLRAGWVLGVVEGLGRAAGSNRKKGAVKAGGEEGGVDGKKVEGVEEEVLRLVRVARAELRIEKLMGEEWIDGEGSFKWEVDDGRSKNVQDGSTHKDGLTKVQEEDSGVTFKHVAAAHPVLRKWHQILEEFGQRNGMRLGFVEENAGAPETTNGPQKVLKD